MSFPRGPGTRSFARVGPSRPAGGPVFAVGWRAVVIGRAGKANGGVVLTDGDGTTALGTVATGLEVEILAWRPYGANGTRYRVLSRKGGTEGWLGAASLAPLLPPARKPAPGPTRGRSTPAGPRPLVVGEPRAGVPPIAAGRSPVKAVKPVKHPARSVARKSR